jgi:hypothetical protein
VCSGNVTLRSNRPRANGVDIFPTWVNLAR